MRVKLPNGLLDGSDLFNYAEVDELRGKQQNYLADQDLTVQNIGHIPKLLKDLVKSLQTEQGLAWKGNIAEGIEKLPTGDIDTILINIRIITYGERYYFECSCPHCENHEKDRKTDLSNHLITPISIEDMMNTEKRSFVLPKSQLQVELRPTYMKDLFGILKIAKERRDKLVTSSLALAIKRLGDKSDITPEDLDEIPATDLMFLKAKHDELVLQGEIDIEVEVECDKCKKDYTIKLDIYSPDFFDPSRASMSQNT